MVLRIRIFNNLNLQIIYPDGQYYITATGVFLSIHSQRYPIHPCYASLESRCIWYAGSISLSLKRIPSPTHMHQTRWCSEGTLRYWSLSPMGSRGCSQGSVATAFPRLVDERGSKQSKRHTVDRDNSKGEGAAEREQTHVTCPGLSLTHPHAHISDFKLHTTVTSTIPVSIAPGSLG